VRRIGYWPRKLVAAFRPIVRGLSLHDFSAALLGESRMRDGFPAKGQELWADLARVDFSPFIRQNFTEARPARREKRTTPS
jgi:hypothetical protein